ncbi:hypothetical protein RRG08_029105 [Elysia crispata]|uniref:Reverse transcriptase domain-containing protein n=2 Tax=Elysia crispata TaxID=231223 RepID=A0AAE1D3W0_9GAST|nr:hypothetical protein RRG08_029105 [Elysia crispata]
MSQYIPYKQIGTIYNNHLQFLFLQALSVSIQPRRLFFQFENDNVQWRIQFPSYTTDWINLEIGNAMGFTISPILFVIAMEVILKAAEDSAGPANLCGGCCMPSLKAFMDDTTIICLKEDEARRMLERLDILMVGAE